MVTQSVGKQTPVLSHRLGLLGYPNRRKLNKKRKELAKNRSPAVGIKNNTVGSSCVYFVRHKGHLTLSFSQGRCTVYDVGNLVITIPDGVLYFFLGYPDIAVSLIHQTVH